jgi:predicted Ser/Thr protein kinase
MESEVACLQCGKPYDSSVVENRFGGVCPACLAKFAADDSGEIEQSPGLGDPSLKPPLKLGGTFHGLEVVELLGAGGMGVVYKARQPGLDRFVALKVLSPKLTSDPEFVARFNREAKAMAALSHSSIVQVFDFGQEADLCFLVMEFVDGVSLRHLMKDRHLAPEQALRVVPRICEALEYAHSKGVIHRDIKPENILLDRDGRVKIADFGLARMLSGDAGGSPLTVSRVVMGTPGYMAPEQYQSMRVDHRADIYSLGAVFYEMLTGELPVGRFDPPSSKIQVDVRLDEIVLKTLATLPERRYQRAVDVKTDVETFADRPRSPLWPHPVEARAPSDSSPGPVPGRASPLAIAALVIMVVSYVRAFGVIFDIKTIWIPGFGGESELSWFMPFLLMQVLAVVLSIISLARIAESGGRVTGRLYAYLAVFLALPPFGLIAGWILWRRFERPRIPKEAPRLQGWAEASTHQPAAELSGAPRLSRLAAWALIFTMLAILQFGAAVFVPAFLRVRG